MNKNKVNIIIDAVDRASPQIGQVDKRLAALASSIKVMGVAMAGAAVAGMARATQQAIATADKYAKLAQQTGLSVEALSTLDHAAKLSGTSVKALGEATKRMARGMNDALTGTGEAADAFAELGVSVTKADGTLRDNEEVIKDVADRFAGMEDGAKKTALAMDIFGRSGTELIPLLNNGAAGINKMQEEARRLGLEIDTNTAKSAEKFNDDLQRLKDASNGLARSIMESVLPALGEMAERLQSTFAPTIEQEIANIDTRVKQLQESLQGRERMGKPGGALAGFFQSFYGSAEGIEQEIAELLTLREELAAMLDAGTPGAGGGSDDSDSPAKEWTDKELAAMAKLGDGITDAWQHMHNDRFEVKKRAHEAEMALEEEHAAEVERLWGEARDFWQMQHEERWEVKKRGLDAEIELEEQALKSAEEAARKAKQAADDLGMSFSSAFEDAIINGEKLSNVLQGLAQDIARMVLRQTVTAPLAAAISSGLQGMFGGTTTNADGNVFAGGSVVPFASGGQLVSRPRVFPMAGGKTGLMGEAGEEGIFPLTRVGGKLGIRAELGGSAPPTININQHLDLRGADASAVPQIRGAADQIVNQAYQRVRDSLRRGGELYSLSQRGR